jgi:aryl-alcohol dehydrogenase-like predicted oxidoreductase
MVRSVKVRHIGLCNMAAWQIMKGLAISEKNSWTRFESVQAYYTVAGRDLEREVIPPLQDQQVGLMVWSPLAGGLLSGKFTPDGKGPPGSRRANFDFPVVDKPRAFAVVDVMRPIAQRHGHVMPGCIVRTTAEVLLGLLSDWEFSREREALTGFAELVISPKGQSEGGLSPAHGGQT